MHLVLFNTNTFTLFVFSFLFNIVAVLCVNRKSFRKSALKHYPLLIYMVVFVMHILSRNAIIFRMCTHMLAFSRLNEREKKRQINDCYSVFISIHFLCMTFSDFSLRQLDFKTKINATLRNIF